MKYWLMKTESDVFSIEDLKKCPNQTEPWDGIRNYQARNYMRDDMSIGDRVLFYHSRTNPSVVGTAKVASAPYPDPSSWNPKSSYFDPKSSPENPRWVMVDVQLDEIFSKPLTLSELREVSGLESMLLLKKGMRLSIQPVTKKEFEIVYQLGSQH